MKKLKYEIKKIKMVEHSMNDELMVYQSEGWEIASNFYEQYGTICCIIKRKIV